MDAFVTTREKDQLPVIDAVSWAGSLVRPLSNRYLLVLVSIGTLLLVDQAILQPQLVQLNFSAPAINLAGRQRMLSQKIAKFALALSITDDSDMRDDYVRELTAALEQWQLAHQVLLAGNGELGIPPAAEPSRSALLNLSPRVVAMRDAARLIIEGSVSSSPQVMILLSQEPEYLKRMEAVVAMLESSAQARIRWLRACGVVVMAGVLLLMAAVQYLVIHPAAGLIRSQIANLVLSHSQQRRLVNMLREARDALEQRVTERTRELHETNLLLQSEIAERKAAEVRMRELSADLAHASRVTALGQLASGLAHEINQPLSTIANCAGTLELKLNRVADPDDSLSAAALQIKQAAMRAGAIVRRMRNFVKRGDVHMVRVDLKELVGEVLELCRPELRDTYVALTCDLPDFPVEVLGDPIQLQQVLTNLVHNAVQAMERVAAGERSLHIAIKPGQTEVEVQVQDSGCGFAPVDLRDCFQSFYTTKPNGLGLGLAISHSIVQQHQGRISCENRIPRGAIVRFHLPILVRHACSENTHSHCLCS